jgi:hypothetical protein
MQMSKEAMVPCIVCGAALDNVDSTAENQPYTGTAFSTSGHYGSTSFDPMNGSMIEINLCDPCLTKAGRAGNVLWRRQANALVDREGSIFGWVENPDTPYVLWNPDLDHIEENELESERQDGLVKIVIESQQELFDLVEERGIRTYGGVKLNGNWTPQDIDWLDETGEEDD